MRKITVGAQVSIDGVMQAPGGPTEDPTKGFKFGGWAMPHFNQESREELDRVFQEKFDLLLGRKTYEIFAGYWPYYDEDAPHGGIAKLFKDIKKYAVSRSGEVDTSWTGSVLLRDIADVKRLKQEDGPDLVTQGSHTDMEHNRKPSWYQVSSEDRMINPESQKHMSGRMNPRKVITLAASHASLASKPVDVSALIDAAATELVSV